MKNAINWFEIPVKNFDRAKKFYETALDISLQVNEDMLSDNFKMAMFPCDMEKEGVGGAIVQAQYYEPSEQGTVIYLNGGNDLSIPLARIEKAGGKVLVPKTSIGEYGFMAQFVDTEGNRLAFHSMQ